MATVIDRPNGHRWIQFTGGDGHRRTLRLGKCSRKDAERVEGHVSDILSSQGLGQSPATSETLWLKDLDDTFYAKLAAVGLVEPRSSATLGAYLDEFIEARMADTRPNTQAWYKVTQKALVEMLGANKPLRAIHAGHAEDLRLFMVNQGLNENTLRRRLGIARQFFKMAERRRLVDKNPFADISVSVKGNPDRFYFLSQEDTQKLLAACPDNQWRLIIALARYGGLRTPSETLALTWGDVNWEQGRLNVPQPKMETRGKPSRLVPIFPELLPHLQAAFDEAEPGALHLITRYREAGCNLRTQLLRIIARAGLAPWPKLFQNMRSTRQTELTATFPAHVVCSWIGNSVDVANNHYLQTTDAHFAKAIAGTGEAESNPKQKPKQFTTVEGVIRQQAKTENRVLGSYNAVCERMEDGVCARQESNLQPSDS